MVTIESQQVDTGYHFESLANAVYWNYERMALLGSRFGVLSVSHETDIPAVRFYEINAGYHPYMYLEQKREIVAPPLVRPLSPEDFLINLIRSIDGPSIPYICDEITFASLRGGSGNLELVNPKLHAYRYTYTPNNLSEMLPPLTTTILRAFPPDAEAVRFS